MKRKNILSTAMLALWMVACTPQKGGMEFFVSPDGDDNQSGAIEAPFLSIEKAQEAVRTYKQLHGLPSGGITVWLRGGVYPIRQTLRFSADDSGKEGAPIIYKACTGEDVRFSGGQAITFEPLGNSGVKARIRAPHDRIVQSDLTKQGITDFGRRKATGFGRATVPSPLELFYNGEPMTLARYPNKDEWMRIVSVPQTGDSIFGGDERTGRGVHYGRFVYEDDRIAGWRMNDDIWLQGYWTWDWADSFVKVDSIDVRKKEFILGQPHGAYGYSPNHRYYAMNILEELDSPGEWYLDTATGILYFWPPDQAVDGQAVVSVMEDLMVHLDHVEHLRMEGITFEYTRGTVITIDEGCHNLIGGCVIRNIGNDAVGINGGHHNGVVGCDLYNLGDAGIQIQGGDRLTLTPGHNFADNNHIHHFSRTNWTYRPAITLNGCGNRMSHNHIHDSPHMAVGFGGNEHVLEFNEVHDIARQTGDVGAFYIGRDWTMRGNIIRYNYFHHLFGPGLHGVNAVYLDDFACGTTIYGNIFYQAGKAAFIGGGHDNRVENNIFIDCDASIHLDARGMNWARYYMIRETLSEMFDKLEAVDYLNPPYSVRYPELTHILDMDPGQPRGNVFRHNLSYGGKWRDMEQAVDEAVIENNYILRETPPSIDPSQWKLYPDNEEILEMIHFQKIPFDRIGLQKDEYRN